MAVYKIPQDVEADDKFLGPLSFKQFIFGGVALMVGYAAFYLGILKGFWPIILMALPIMIVTGFLAFPWGRDQPTEVWLAGKLRFALKPRKRIWNQSGLKELVTITAPKKIERILTNNLSQDEVKSRLGALSTMLDSRGWAIKNIDVNLYGNNLAVVNSDERLIDTSSLPQETQTLDIGAADDMMDSVSNTNAHHIDELMQQSKATQRAEIQATMTSAKNDTPATSTSRQQNNPSSSQDFWFMNQGQAPPTQPGYASFSDPTTVRPSSTQTTASDDNLTAEDQALLKHVHEDEEREKHTKQFGKMKTLEPIDRSNKNKPKPSSTSTAHPANDKPVTAPVDPAILNLASRDDLNVATIARQAAEITKEKDGEVVIRLQH